MLSNDQRTTKATAARVDGEWPNTTAKHGERGRAMPCPAAR